MNNSNNLLLSDFEPDKILLYDDVDLNALFNFSYNFDLLKGIIGTLLKNQQALQKQIQQVNDENHEQNKTIIELRREIIEIQEKYTPKVEFVEVKDKMKKMNELYQAFDEESTKSKYKLYKYFNIK